MACAICKGRHCLACEDAFAAKITGILARGAVEIALAERESKPNASGPSGDVGDGSASVRDPSTGLPIAQAPVVSDYERGVAETQKIVEDICEREAEKHRAALAALVRLREDLASEIRWRLGQDVIRRDGEE